MVQEFVQQIHDSVEKQLNCIHTAIPGEIIAFDAVKGLATVKPVMKYRKPDGTAMDYPAVYGVPVVIPQSISQKATIAFPIEKGDGCLLVFAEKSLDLWMYGQETDTDLHFDLSDAICIPGLFNKPNAILKEACEKKAVIVDVSGTKATVKSGAVQIDAQKISLNGNVEIKGDLKVSGGTVYLN